MWCELVNEPEIHKMIKSADVDERKKAADELEDNFAFFSDKVQAWKDLLALTKDEDSSVRWHAARALGSAFAPLTDNLTEKEQATKDLLALTKDEDSSVSVRREVACALCSAFARCHVEIPIIGTNKYINYSIYIIYTERRYA